MYTFLHAFGDSTWKKGLNYYLTNRINNFASSDDLYEALQRAVNEDYPASTPNVAEIMKTWEHQGGFPLITVSRNDSRVTISQERFFYGSDVSDSLWHVPISYYTSSTPNASKTTADFWISNSQSTTLTTVVLDKIKDANDWIIFNTQQVRFKSQIWRFININF